MSDEYGFFDDLPLSDFDLDAQSRLFVTGPDWRNHAVQWSLTRSGLPYALSFHTAGNALVARALQQREHDFLVFPILYCYRHAVELALKDLIYLGQRGHGGPAEVIRTHRLDDLWRRASAVLERAFETLDPAHEHVGRLIEELAVVDPAAEQFRYDRDRTGRERYLPDALMRVDLPHIRTMIAKVIAYLDVSHTAIFAMLDAMPDY